jgi:hypothetical protein
VNSLSLPTGVNSSAIYVFLLLQWLITAPHSIEELQQCYEAHPWCAKRISDDSIRLYLNTLRALGCLIERPSSKNNYRYQLLAQSFTLTDPKRKMNLLVKLFSGLDPSTNRAVILQRYIAMKALVNYSGIELEQLSETIPFVALHPVPLNTLIAYTQKAESLFTSYQVSYKLPSFDKTNPKKADAIQTWTVIPLGLLQEKGRLYCLVWEVIANQTPQWVQRMLRYDRIISIEPLVLPNNIQHYFEELTASYFNALPYYKFSIFCPVGINFSGLGFPHEQVSISTKSFEELSTQNTFLQPEMEYFYTVQTDFTFLLLQRLFALQGHFTIIEAPEKFHTELQTWSTNTLANYQ